MTSPSLAALCVVFLGLTFAAWRRYLWVAGKGRFEQEDTCPYSLTDVFGDNRLVNVPHQKGVQWLTEVLQPLRHEVPRSHGPADPPHRTVPDIR